MPDWVDSLLTLLPMIIVVGVIVGLFVLIIKNPDWL